MDNIPLVQVQVLEEYQKLNVGVWLARRLRDEWPDRPDLDAGDPLPADADPATIELARRREVMLAQLAALADDTRLHPDSRVVVKWLGREVRAASTGERLAELAALLRESGIRRRYRWQGRPDALDPDADDDMDDQPGDEPDLPESCRDDDPDDDDPRSSRRRRRVRAYDR